MEVLQLEPILESLQQRRNLKVNLDFKQREKMEEFLKHLLLVQTEMSKHPEDITLEPALKMHLLLIINEFYKIGLFQSQFTVNNFLGQKVKEAIHYIDKNYKALFQLDDLAVSMGISKYYISHLFKEETKFTIVEYLQYRRVIEAQKLLAHNVEPIIEVGMECGFQSLQHFYRVFKKIAKKSPLQYRSHFSNEPPLLNFV
jgi:AraC-like DNA-binding protein